MWLFFHYNIQHIFTFLQHEAKHHSKVKEIIISLSKKLLWYYGLFPSKQFSWKNKNKNKNKKTEKKNHAHIMKKATPWASS